MRWIADECISAKLVAALRADGHDVVYIAESLPSAKDRSVLDLAIAENRLLLTEDRDFGELIFAQSLTQAPGVVFMRIPDERAHLAWPRLKALIARFGDDLASRYIVVEEARFRVRLLER